MALVHVPMALSTQGSTLMTVAQSIVDASGREEVASRAVLSHNRAVSLRDCAIDYVDYTTVNPREWFSRRELATDVVAGALGLLRPYHGHMYDPAIAAVSNSSGDVILLYEGHYASASLPRWSRVRDRSTVVLYVHNPLSRTYGRTELTRLLEGADFVAFCADHLRQDVERRLRGRLADRLLTVHNGVDPSFTPAERTSPAPEQFTVLFAGLTAPHKGPHLVLEAVQRASRLTDRRLRVQIIGSSAYGHQQEHLTPYEQSLRQQAAAIDADVEFLPFLSKAELSEIMREASVACLPSQWAEGLPLIALESMASGLPVVTSDSVGMVEAVADAGIVVPGGDPEGMAAALVELAASQAQCEEFSRRSLQRAAQFSWDAVARIFAGMAPEDRSTNAATAR